MGWFDELIVMLIVVLVQGFIIVFLNANTLLSIKKDVLFMWLGLLLKGTLCTLTFPVSNILTFIIIIKTLFLVYYTKYYKCILSGTFVMY